MTDHNPFGSRKPLTLAEGGEGTYYSLAVLEEQGIAKLGALPYSIRVLLETALRNHDDFLVREEDVAEIDG